MRFKWWVVDLTCTKPFVTLAHLKTLRNVSCFHLTWLVLSALSVFKSCWTRSWGQGAVILRKHLLLWSCVWEDRIWPLHPSGDTGFPRLILTCLYHLTPTSNCAVLWTGRVSEVNQYTCILWKPRGGSRILVRGPSGVLTSGGPWAQHCSEIGFFPLKVPENCMILKKKNILGARWGPSPQAPLDRLVEPVVGIFQEESFCPWLPRVGQGEFCARWTHRFFAETFQV